MGYEPATPQSLASTHLKSMNLLPSLLLLLAPAQDWRAYPLPSVSSTPASPASPQLLVNGSHIALRPDPRTQRVRTAEALVAPSLLSQLIAENFSRSSLSLLPNSRPLMVRAADGDHQELQAILAALDAAGDSLQIRVEAALLPGILETPPALSDAPAWYSGELRTGDSLTFGARTEVSFLGGYEVDVATDSGAADPLRSSAATGETIHLRCSRVQGGRAVHVEGVLDLSALMETSAFDPDTPDLGEVEQPRLSVAQLAFSGVVEPGAPLRVTLKGAGTFGDRTLFIRASTKQDLAAPTAGWAVRDLAFLASAGLPLEPPQPGLDTTSELTPPMPRPAAEVTPGSLVGLLSGRSASGGAPTRIYSTERLLLIPAQSLKALAETEALIQAMEAPLLTQRACTVNFGDLKAELPATHGRIVRVLVGEEQPLLVDYRTEIAPNTWMPSPVTELLFDGVCFEAACETDALSGRFWVSDTLSVQVTSSSFANLGALQKVERSFAGGGLLVRAGEELTAGPLRLTLR